jgi:transcription initiation factor TFIID subunit 7
MPRIYAYPVMEHHFILRLPDSLQSADVVEANLVLVSSKEIQLTVNNRTYSGIVCRPPTIIESHKNAGNKLYKISDVSGLIIINEDPSENICENIAENISKVEASGITPPMFLVKERWFSNDEYSEDLPEDVEDKIMELLEEDSKAAKVEILNEENNCSLDMLAAEIEKEIPVNNEQSCGTQEAKDTVIQVEGSDGTTDRSAQNIKIESRELEELEDKIKKRKEMVDNALNPILKKRFQSILDGLMEEYENKKK